MGFGYIADPYQKESFLSKINDRWPDSHREIVCKGEIPIKWIILMYCFYPKKEQGEEEVNINDPSSYETHGLIIFAEHAREEVIVATSLLLRICCCNSNVARWVLQLHCCNSQCCNFITTTLFLQFQFHYCNFIVAISLVNLGGKISYCNTMIGSSYNSSTMTSLLHLYIVANMCMLKLSC